MSNNPVAESLKKVLASSYILSLKTQNYHWNVKGPHFKQLHDLFGEQYNELNTAIDDIAERIRALGAPLTGSKLLLIRAMFRPTVRSACRFRCL